MTDTQSKQDAFDALASPKTSVMHRIAMILRIAGVFLVFSSTLFIINQHNAPKVSFLGFTLQNAHLGNILLTLGMLFFGIYLFYRFYLHFKKSP